MNLIELLQEDYQDLSVHLTVTNRCLNSFEGVFVAKSSIKAVLIALKLLLCV